MMRNKIWCVIPVFNNSETVYAVATQCRAKMEYVVVVDDGSTDGDVSSLFQGTDITVLKHATNKGKGAAILTAVQFVKEHAGTHIITIDGDGQHYPADLSTFIPLLDTEDNVVVIGVRNLDDKSVPKSSRVGRMIANFWMRVETGISLKDCQSGFRAYSVGLFSAITFKGTRYDFETEILTRAAWAGVAIKEVEISVLYPKPENRISHFRPLVDNARISCMHARLVGRALMPIPHKKIAPRKGREGGFSILKHPLMFVKMLLKENASPLGLAVSAGVGIFLAVLPLIALHTVAIIYVTARLHLNKVMALSIQQLCMPPFVPLLCIELGYYFRYGQWLTNISRDAVFGHVAHRLFDWLIGS
jgi:glycosyltransferase involved in cell wall biosynthesis